MKATQLGVTLMGSAVFCGTAAGQSAPLEIESEFEAVTVIRALGNTDSGTDAEDILYEITLDNRIEKVLENGLQIGGRLTLRGQRDHPQRPGFLGDFGAAPGPRGAYSGLSGTPPGNDTGLRGQLETAYLEFDGGYGELRIGRDRGAASRMFEGAPSVLTHAGISNPYLDPNGIKINRTNHDLTGPAEKLTYASPRILGLRAAASFTPDASVPGLDRDVDRPDGQTELKNAIEVGLNLSRRLPRSGIRIETGIGWSSAEVDSPAIRARDRVGTYSAGANFEFDSFEVGGSWLSSDNGYAGADYQAWEIGIATEFRETEFSLNYGEADDDLAMLKGDGFSVAARREIADGLEFALAYQDEGLSASSGEFGGRGLVVEITLGSEFFGLTAN